MTLVVVDADVLGRQRTGDETYVRNLLGELPSLAAEHGVRIGAVTRRPELVAEGIEPLHLDARRQELRMAWMLPRLLRRAGAHLVHTQYAVPLRCPCPAVVTVHDLSFARSPELMGWRDRRVFRAVVPRAVRRAATVLTVSERTRRDLEELYRLTSSRVVVIPNGVDAVFTPQGAIADGRYALSVGAVQARKDQAAALFAAREVGLDLVIAGPEKDRGLAEELRRGGARLEGHVDPERLAALYRGAACLVQASRYEGFGLPVLEAMACGTPVVAVEEPALREVAGDAAVIVPRRELADGIRRALAERDRWVQAGFRRARGFTWRRAAERTLAVYLDVLASTLAR